MAIAFKTEQAPMVDGVPLAFLSIHYGAGGGFLSYSLFALFKASQVRTLRRVIM